MTNRHPYDRLGRIATPKEGMANCRTPEMYARAHVAQMTAKREAFHALDVRLPWDAPTAAVPFINGGKWVVLCDCGDAPMASPAWDIARCFNCGAIYRSLAWPAEREAIEAALLDRPQAITRSWLAGESLADLQAQNVEHGLGTKGGQA